MLNLGLKLWSLDFIKNKEFIKSAMDNLHAGHFSYVELFALPNSFEDTKEEIAKHLKDVPVIVHAPHIMQGIDIGKIELFDDNIKKHKDSIQFADMLNAKHIIVHAHLQGTTESAIKHIKTLNDKRIIIESLPYFEMHNKEARNKGINSSTIKQIMDETGCGLCLDFSHIISAANARGIAPFQALYEFHKLKPNMYHICDGEIKGAYDEHLHFGQGNYPLKELIEKYVTPGLPITMETGFGVPTNTDKWKNDSIYLNRLFK